MNPKVSIIMGVHNLSSNSMKAIESIINQTYRDWEFIICNDGSTDNTSEQLKKISKLDKRIIILENRINKGLAYSLNQCIKKSRGKYIARMDDDDFSKENRIEEEVNFLDRNSQYAFVSSEYVVNNGEKIIAKKRKMKERPNKYDFERISALNDFYIKNRIKKIYNLIEYEKINCCLGEYENAYRNSLNYNQYKKYIKDNSIKNSITFHNFRFDKKQNLKLIFVRFPLLAYIFFNLRKGKNDHC